MHPSGQHPAKAVVQAMQKQFNLTDDDTQNISDVNATIGKETQSKAITAALVAVVLMMIYSRFASS